MAAGLEGHPCPMVKGGPLRRAVPCVVRSRHPCGSSLSSLTLEVGICRDRVDVTSCLRTERARPRASLEPSRFVRRSCQSRVQRSTVLPPDGDNRSDTRDEPEGPLVQKNESNGPCPLSALAGRHDNGDVICQMRRAVNPPNPSIQSERVDCAPRLAYN